MYPYGDSASDSTVSGDDDASYAIALENKVFFYNSSYSTIYISTNGLVSMTEFSSYSSKTLNKIKVNLIAPLYADFDSSSAGSIYYRETTDSPLLTTITNDIKSYFTNSYTDLSIDSAFIVTWDSVPLYTDSSATATFQLTLARSSACQSFALMSYLALSSAMQNGLFRVGYASLNGLYASEISKTTILNEMISENYEKFQIVNLVNNIPACPTTTTKTTTTTTTTTTKTLTTTIALSTKIADIYPYGEANSDTELTGSDDASYAISLIDSFVFYNKSYQTVYVSTNGLVSMQSYPLFSTKPLNKLNANVLSPLFADLDTSSSGHIYYRQSQDETFLAELKSDIESDRPEFKSLIDISWALVVTWVDVPHFTDSSKKSTFQLVLTTTTDYKKSFAVYLYSTIGVDSTIPFRGGHSTSDGLFYQEFTTTELKRLMNDAGLMPARMSYLVETFDFSALTTTTTTTSTTTSTTTPTTTVYVPTTTTEPPCMIRIGYNKALSGHNGVVHVLVVLPNGDLASGSDDNTIRIWDKDDGSPILTLQGHTGRIFSLAVLPNGYLASSADDKKLKIWSTNETSPLRIIELIRSVYALAVLTNGYLAVADQTTDVRIFDPNTGDSIKTITSTVSVYSLAVLPNGYLAGGCYDGAIYVWNTDDSSLNKTLKEHSRIVNSLVVLRNGYLASASDDTHIKIWNPNVEQSIRMLAHYYGSVNSLAVLPNGYLASGGQDQTIKIWKTEDGTMIDSYRVGGCDSVYALAVLESGFLVSGGTYDSNVDVWSMETDNGCYTTSTTRAPPSPTTTTPTTTTSTTTTTTPTTTVYVPTTTTEAPCSITLAFNKALEGHNDIVKVLLAFPNGYLASASSDSVIIIWNDYGMPIRTLEGHTGRIFSLAMLPNGYLVSGAEDQKVKIWTTNETTPLRTISASGTVTALAVLTNGHLAVGDLTTKVKIFDPNTGDSIAEITSPSAVKSLAALPNGFLAGGCLSGAIYVWNTADQSLSKTLSEHSRMVNSLAVLPSGLLVSASDDSSIKFWNPNVEQSIRTETHDSVISLTVLPNGYLASGGKDQIINIWKPDDGSLIHSLQFGTSVFSLAVLQSGFLVGTYDNSVFVLSVLSDGCYVTSATQAPPTTTPTTTTPTTTSPTTTVYVPTTTTEPPCMMTLSLNKALSGHANLVNKLVVLPNGNLASGSGDTTIRIWDKNDGSLVRTLEGHRGPIYSLAVLTNGYLASGSGDFKIKIWTTEDASPLRTITLYNNVRALAVLANGYLAAGDTTTDVKIFDPNTGDLINTIASPSNVYSLVVLPNGFLAVGGGNGAIYVWNTDDQSLNKTLTGHSRIVRSLVVLPNGYLASASDDSYIKIWNPNAEQPIRTLSGHDYRVLSLTAFSNGYLASGGEDTTIKIWNPNSGALIYSIFSGYVYGVLSLVPLQSGFLASAGENLRDINIWSVESNGCYVTSTTVAPPTTTSTTTPTTTTTSSTSTTTTSTTTVYIPTMTTTPFVPIYFTEFPVSNLYSFGTVYSDRKLPKKDDISFGPISLNNPFSFGDNSYSNVYISTNGYVTFSYYDEFMPILANDLSLAIIAPLFNDFDTKKKGDVFYRETTDSATLSSISSLIKTLFEQTPSDLVLSSVFITTWSSVPLYGLPDTSNTFQLVLASYNNCYSYVLFLYQTLSSQSDFKAGYYADLQTNGQVASGVIEALLGSGTSTGYAFKINPASQCS